MIKVQHFQEAPDTEEAPGNPEIYVIEVSDQESIKQYKTFVDRGLNCWPDAPKDLKDMGDMFTHGRITQDHTYQRMNTTQNTDLATAEEYAEAQKIIAEWGQDRWKEGLITGKSWQEIYARLRK